MIVDEDTELEDDTVEEADVVVLGETAEVVELPVKLGKGTDVEGVLELLVISVVLPGG